VDEMNVYPRSLSAQIDRSGMIGHTHGKTYKEAARMGTELLELLIEGHTEDGKALPQPDLFQSEPD
jgi:hypothetical protein